MYTENALGRALLELPLYKPTGALRLSARRSEQRIDVFLDIARTLAGKIRMIPAQGGSKYQWEEKITFHLDLEEVASLAYSISAAKDKSPFCLYHQYRGEPKTLSVQLSGKYHGQVKAAFRNQEIMLTLQDTDLYLLRKGLDLIISECLWKIRA